MSKIDAPGVLIPLNILRAYRNDPATLSRLIFAALDTIEGEPVKVENTAETLVVAEITQMATAGLESYKGRSEHARTAANARWAGRRRADKPAPAASEPIPAAKAVETPRRVNANWEFALRDNPLQTILTLVNEVGNEWSMRTFTNFLNAKDEDAILEEVRAFHSELEQGERPKNLGAALISRFKALPNKGAVVYYNSPAPAPVAPETPPETAADDDDDGWDERLQAMRAEAFAKICGETLRRA